jgi:hypothetical protein
MHAHAHVWQFVAGDAVVRFFVDEIKDESREGMPLSSIEFFELETASLFS